MDSNRLVKIRDRIKTMQKEYDLKNSNSFNNNQKDDWLDVLIFLIIWLIFIWFMYEYLIISCILIVILLGKLVLERVMHKYFFEKMRYDDKKLYVKGSYQTVWSRYRYRKECEYNLDDITIDVSYRRTYHRIAGFGKYKMIITNRVTGIKHRWYFYIESVTCLIDFYAFMVLFRSLIDKKEINIDDDRELELLCKQVINN